MNKLPKISFTGHDGYHILMGDVYYPVDKKTLTIYEPFKAHSKTKEQLSPDAYYFSSLKSALKFVSSKK